MLRCRLRSCHPALRTCEREPGLLRVLPHRTRGVGAGQTGQSGPQTALAQPTPSRSHALPTPSPRPDAGQADAARVRSSLGGPGSGPNAEHSPVQGCRVAVQCAGHAWCRVVFPTCLPNPLQTISHTATTCKEAAVMSEPLPLPWPERPWPGTADIPSPRLKRRATALPSSPWREGYTHRVWPLRECGLCKRTETALSLRGICTFPVLSKLPSTSTHWPDRRSPPVRVAKARARRLFPGKPRPLSSVQPQSLFPPHASVGPKPDQGRPPIPSVKADLLGRGSGIMARQEIHD